MSRLKQHLRRLGTAVGITVMAVPAGVAGRLVLAMAQPVAADVFVVSQPTDIGNLGGNYSSSAAINDLGQVTGSSSDASGNGRAFLWTKTGGIHDIGAFTPVAINNAGQVAGYAGATFFQRHAAFWTSSNGIIDLGTLPGGSYSHAVAVNASGQVVGYGNDSSGHDHAFLWTSSGGMVDLGTLPGHTSSKAVAINGAGQVIGNSSDSANVSHAFLWTSASGFQDLGTLPGGSYSQAVAINDAGQAAGTGGTSSGHSHAFFWTSAGGMVDLGVLPNTTDSHASAINAAGEVVGASFGFGPPYTKQHAFLWNATDGIVDLGFLPGYGDASASEPVAINDSEQVVGTIRDISSGFGPPQPFVWTRSRGMDPLYVVWTSFGIPAGYVVGINNHGEVAGGSQDGHANYWTLTGHLITSSAGPGGSISPLGNNAYPIGSDAQFYIAAEPYYHISEVAIDGAPVTVTAEHTFTYTFTNISADHTIAATFVPVDINVSSPYEGAFWPRGTNQRIEWTYVDSPGKVVVIDLLKGGKAVQQISSGVGIKSSPYVWHVPAKLPPGADYQIRATSKTNSHHFDTGGPFMIQ